MRLHVDALRSASWNLARVVPYDNDINRAGPVSQPEPAEGDLETAGPTAASVSTATPPRGPTRTRLYRQGRLLDEGFPAEEIRERLDGAPDAVVWLDRHASLSFAKMDAVAVDDDTAELTTTEISVFITARALITVRKADFDVDTLIERWDLNRELAATSGIGFLYGLLDAIVDGHYAAVETLDDAVTGLEYVLFQPRATVDPSPRLRTAKIPGRPAPGRRAHARTGRMPPAQRPS
jgi:magnesium transporter